MSESEVTSIIEVINESFSKTIPPDDNADAIFGPGWHPEQESFMEMIHGKDWKGFLEVLETSDQAQVYGRMFNFMTPYAYHYYAPAFLIFSMNEEADILADAFLSSLHGAGSEFVTQGREHQQQRIQERLIQFSESQKHAIALVIDYYYRINGAYLPDQQNLVVSWSKWL